MGNQGQLGHGSAESLQEPRLVELLLGLRMVKVAAGGWHSMALSDEGGLYVWGWNNYGQLGLKTENDDDVADPIEKEDENELEPVQLQFVPTCLDVCEPGTNNDLEIEDISCGARHSIALAASGHVYAWGWNKYGQLGLSQRKKIIQGFPHFLAHNLFVILNIIIIIL